MDPISKKPRGKAVSTRMLKAHTVADRQAAFHAAEQNTMATFEIQIEEVTAYLSATVLTDEVSGPSLTPGGSLWSRLDNYESIPPQDKPTPAPKQACPQPSMLPASYGSHPSSHPRVPSPSLTPLHSLSPQAGSRCSREARIIASLANIEVEVDALHHEALDNLAHLGQPSSSGPPTSFPFADLFLSSKDLKSRLETIMFKAPAVIELKGSILRKLQYIDYKLTTAKKVWNEGLSNIKAMMTPGFGLPYETGKVLPC